MAVVDSLIQTGTMFGVYRTGLVRDSHGNIYVCYAKTDVGNYFLTAAVSQDGGINWTESSISYGSSDNPVYPGVTIDSSDTIHVVYLRTSYIIAHRSFTLNGGWSSETIIYDGTSTTDQFSDGFSVAIDSFDNIHVVWSQEYLVAGISNILYSKRISGVWSSPPTVLDSIGSNSTLTNPFIAVDSNNYLHVSYTHNDWGSDTSSITYVKYTSSWSAFIYLGTFFGFYANKFSSIVVDSSDNLHVVWIGRFTAHTAFINVQYIKYTRSTDSWGTVTIIATEDKNYTYPTITIDDSDNLTVFAEYNNDIYIITYSGSWSTSVLLTHVSPASYNESFSPSTIFPVINGGKINQQTIGYHFIYRDRYNGVDTLRYYASDGFTAPTGTTNYSRKASASLPATDSNLSNLFTSAEYAEVETVDNLFATQSATDQYSIFEFKNKGNSSSDNIVVTWVGQSNIAPSTSTVYLQIYNRNSSTWETLDSNSAAAAGGNFSLSGTKTSSLSNYYDASNWVSCRVYQLAA